MKNIKAIGFDLFNTLITLDFSILDTARTALISSLEQSGFTIKKKAFEQAYMTEAVKCFKKARKDGIEIHNSLWISRALNTLGHDVLPEDPRILKAVDDYFVEFHPAAKVIPGTVNMLEKLKKRYRLGLLSNFTHAPFVRDLMDQENLARFFDVILISDELGFCKPNPRVFQKLIDLFGIKENEIMYIGDDPKADIEGAQKAGIYPVWTTIVKDQNSSSPAFNLFPETEDPSSEISRISTWKDLFSLLDIA